MNKIALLAIVLSAATLTSNADNSRYVTVTATNGSSPAMVQILDGEMGEIYSWAGNGGPCTVQKNGLTIPASPPSTGSQGSDSTHGTSVVGPATFSFECAGYGAMLTVKITPIVYDVNKTLIIPPGTNQVYVGLESSTNLVNWGDATNGVYGSPDVARFFRIRMQRLTP
jgi:hypothetical protein